MNRLAALIAISSILSGAVAPIGAAMAQTASGLGDLIGARGSSAEDALGSRGYQASGNKGAASMWWNSSSRTCVSMFVDNGRVQSIQSTSAGDCGKGGGGNGAVAAVAGLAAIGLIAALASHHKKADDDHQSANHDSEYQRGYNDAIYGARYDNNDNEAYHSGYMDGESERQNRWSANSSYVRSGAPQSAKDACARRGDDYLGMPAGTSVPVNVSGGRGNYEIVVAAGHYRARCSVDANGNVTGINPY